MKRIISLLIVFCLLNFSFGCSSTKVYTIKDLRRNIKSNSYLILHTPSTKYKLTNYKFEDEKLVGDLMKFKSKNGTYYHVYTAADFWGELNENASFNIQLPADHISEIKQRTTNSVRTGFIVLGIALVIFGGIAAISVQNMDINWGGTSN